MVEAGREMVQIHEGQSLTVGVGNGKSEKAGAGSGRNKCLLPA
jgi:hypothetical protein